MLTLLALLAGAAPGTARHALGSAAAADRGAGLERDPRRQAGSAAQPEVVARPPSGRSLVFRTRRIGRGKYKVRLVLNRAGRWTFSAARRQPHSPPRAVTVSSVPPPTSPLPGGTAYRVCGGAPRARFSSTGWQSALGSAWIACRKQRAVQRIDLATGGVAAR